MDVRLVSKQIAIDIDNYCLKHFDEGHPRSHLGASQIGHTCNKYLWLVFRWIAHKKHSGRIYRLLNRGHFEEPKLRALMIGAGFEITEFDAEAVARGETDKGKMQIRISACKGHFGGSVDGIGYREDTGKVLIEYKTQGLGKQGNKVSNFEKLVKQGVKEYKPQHFAQMSIYGYKLNLKHAIYISVCKNDDDLHIEAVELDWNLGAALEHKAEMIIFSQEPPQGVSCSPGYFECNYCDMKGICYEQQEPLKNCRSCRNSSPVDNAEWQCGFHGIIPKSAIPLEQPCWESII